MHRRSRGNFIVLSGLLIAALIALVGWWAWKIYGTAPELSKPAVVDASGKPAILGSPLPTPVDDGTLAQNIGENKGMKEEAPAEVEAVAPESEGLPPVPKRISSAKEKGKWIFADKANFRLYLVDGSKVLDSWGICVGQVPGNKRKSGDCRTPEGTFTVQQIQSARTWTHDFKDGKGVIKGAYGPWFIRLKTGWNGIGIHGTHDPDSIGTMATEGCIRLKNEDVEKLKPQVTVGMKVVIGPNANVAALRAAKK